MLHYKFECKFEARALFQVEGTTLTVKVLDIVEMKNCDGISLDFEEAYTYSLSDDVLDLSSNACSTKYQNLK